MFKVYYAHVWGGKTHLEGSYDTREEAEKARNDVEDSMFDAWIIEPRESEKED